MYRSRCIFLLTRRLFDSALCLSLRLCLLVAGQRHLPDPGSQKPNERSGADCKGVLRSLHQVPEGVRNGSCELTRGVLADEGPGEEAPGKEGEARGVSDTRATRLPEEAHLPRPGPQRIQGHGLLLRKGHAYPRKEDETWQWRVDEKVPFYIVLTHLCLPCVCPVTPQEDCST